LVFDPMAPTVPVAAPASPPQDRALPANTVHGKQTMTKDLQKSSPATDFAKLKELFGPPPVLSSEDPKAYDAMLARIIESLKASDFIEQLLGKDLMDATWEMKRYSRHKALVIERQIHEQQEMEETEEAEEAEQLEESAEESEQAKQADKPAVKGEQIEQEEVKQAGAPTTQFERMLELAAVVDSVVPDCDDIIAGPVDELENAAALQSGIQYYERLDRLYSVAMARREDVLKQLDLYRQGLGRHLRRVSDDIIEGEFSETREEAPSITGPDAGAQ
jgi:hypothetical protein